MWESQPADRITRTQTTVLPAGDAQNPRQVDLVRTETFLWTTPGVDTHPRLSMREVSRDQQQNWDRGVLTRHTYDGVGDLGRPKRCGGFEGCLPRTVRRPRCQATSARTPRGGPSPWPGDPRQQKTTRTPASETDAPAGLNLCSSGVLRAPNVWQIFGNRPRPDTARHSATKIGGDSETVPRMQISR